MTILTDTKMQEIIEEDGKLRIKVEGKDDITANKALLQSVVFQTLKVSVRSSLNWIVDGSRSMNTWKHLFQVSMHQVISMVLRCWLTLPSVWVK